MTVVSAPIIEDAPLEPARRRFSAPAARRLLDNVERLLELERAQLPLWWVTAFGAGIAGWLWLSGPRAWTALLLVALALATAGVALGPARRLSRALAWGGLALALGCGWIWLRAEQVASPRLERAGVHRFAARVEQVENRAARGDIRLRLAPARSSRLPPRVRVSFPLEDRPEGLAVGAIVTMRARLQPPPPMAFPGTHDFARDAWFAGIGGVGRALGPPEVAVSAKPGGLDSIRARLGQHIAARLPGSPGGIATALATGDQAAVAEDDAEAMRRSGLTHLLSVSGLHIAAVVGAAMIVAFKLLALS
jgi:competence protein ComEC